MRYNNHVRSTSLGHFIGQLAFVALVATGCGGGSGGSSGDPATTPLPGISLLAGSIGGPGNIDGVGAAARFFYPSSLAVDAAGNVYVADGSVRKIAPDGTVTTVASAPGSSMATGALGPATLSGPARALAADLAGTLYVIGGDQSSIQKITPAGAVGTLALTIGPGCAANANAPTSCFNGLSSVAVDTANNLYLTSSTHGVIFKVTPEGHATTLAGALSYHSDPVDGAGVLARFHNPTSIAVDRLGNLFVTDTSIYPLRGLPSPQRADVIRKVTPDGVVTTLAGTAGQQGATDAEGAAASFRYPSGITADQAGNVYVADTHNNLVRKISPTGKVTTLAGRSGAAGSGDTAGGSTHFGHPTAVTADARGNVYVTDSGRHAVHKISPEGIVSTVAGAAEVSGSVDGNAATASFGYLSSVCVDQNGNTVLVDAGNKTIRRITPDGVVSTWAGTPGVAGSTDGSGAVASFSAPYAIAVDDFGNAFVTDVGANTIRKITADGEVSTFAGKAGLSGSTDGLGSDARFDQPRDIAVDRAGNVYVADSANWTVRKITPQGRVTTLAGTAGVAGATNGVGAAASFGDLRGLAADHAGNIYVADSTNHTIRRITPSGVVTALAGTVGVNGSTDGTGTTALFEFPAALAIDSHGNLYAAEPFTHTIRRITPSGMVSTVVGTRGLQGIKLGSLPGSLSDPRSLAFDSKGVLYVVAAAAVLKIQLPR